jgi:hypothetical protein
MLAPLSSSLELRIGASESCEKPSNLCTLSLTWLLIPDAHTDSAPRL